MKLLALLSFFVLASAVVLPGPKAQAQQQMSKGQYLCIADTMQATNSDIYYNLPPQEIDQMLADENAIGHDLAVAAAKHCGVN